MYIYPKTLSLITTHQCTAACDHCCFHCTPKVTKAIPTERLHSLIDEACDIPSIKLIVFTGGECFLLGKELFKLIEKSHNKGFATRCVSNGYWATEKNCNNIVKALVKAGLDEINFSTGEFHSKYVPIERVVRAAIACAKAGIRVLIPIESCKNSGFSYEAIYNNADIIALQKEGKVILNNTVWIENGGDKDLEYHEETSRFKQDNISGCSTALSVVAVTPDQNLMGCCGLHMEKISELKLGSTIDKRLGDVIKEAPDDFIKIWVHVAGPERILNFVKEHEPAFDLPLESPHPCESCLFLYTNSTARKVIRDHYHEIEDEISELYMAGITQHMLKDNVVRDLSLTPD